MNSLPKTTLCAGKFLALIQEGHWEYAHRTTGPASSCLTAEMVTLLLASGLRWMHAGGGVGHENITVHEIPLNEVHDWLAAKEKEGMLIEPKVYAGLYLDRK